ncbi:MAG: hypothetical protein SVR04_10005 [Spirochaetota bacterium]|nr:hypothetical protein [Spirochaetota bacterium]
MGVHDWEEKAFNTEFEQTLIQVNQLRKIDPSFTIDSLRNMLETAYVHQGNDWTGRGSVGDITQEAVIAAYQQYLAQWERELGESDGCSGGGTS